MMKMPPHVCLYDDDVKKYIGKDVKDLSVGDTMSITLKVRVTEVAQEEREDYGRGLMAGCNCDMEKKEGKEEKPKMRTMKRVDMQIVGAGQKPVIGNLGSSRI